ncbi:hypothetical protein JX265_011694 [Neoarthrinium moseri]|uniref:Uncharacterized protein n=1 Tax=Neoarthrinium moseri TaxID=1658444 RepID=A0A9Q0AKK6_9PEZI|nr:uncharacterized protein JN550_013094 [Neoarthrinium moseri]KAI1856447.1 hypothetical protein JX265_011694 [Neoarthrinium moseri]KAI1857758.1 hypothetical protein JN550_013094 [Neoarthrinium moseri]
MIEPRIEWGIIVCDGDDLGFAEGRQQIIQATRTEYFAASRQTLHRLFEHRIVDVSTLSVGRASASLSRSRILPWLLSNENIAGAANRLRSPGNLLALAPLVQLGLPSSDTAGTYLMHRSQTRTTEYRFTDDMSTRKSRDHDVIFGATSAYIPSQPLYLDFSRTA